MVFDSFQYPLADARGFAEGVELFQVLIDAVDRLVDVVHSILRGINVEIIDIRLRPGKKKKTFASSLISVHDLKAKQKTHGADNQSGGRSQCPSTKTIRHQHSRSWAHDTGGCIGRRIG